MIRPLALAPAADRARGEDIIGESVTAGVDGALLGNRTIKISFESAVYRASRSAAPSADARRVVIAEMPQPVSGNGDSVRG